MKVGIITYHRAHNYGAVLQCFALQELIREHGNEVEIIDYRQPFIEKLYGFSKYGWIKRNLFHPRNLLRFNDVVKGYQNTSSIFSDFRNKHLNISKEFSGTEIPEYDAYIVGSDQMWAINCVGNKVDKIYFGDFHRKAGSKLIGFSVSSNTDSINTISADLGRYSDNFDDISFREDKISKLVNKTLGRNYKTTLDPTLCADSSIWDKMTDHNWASRKGYIVVYHVKLRFASVVHDLILKQAHRLAKNNNWDVIDLSSGVYTVSDFVSAIKYAQCVLTSSFHATVFSIIFNRPLFCVKLHDGGDGRYTDLLNSLGMQDALVDLDFDQNYPHSYDDTIIGQRLESLRLPSLEYLFNYLK